MLPKNELTPLLTELLMDEETDYGKLYYMLNVSFEDDLLVAPKESSTFGFYLKDGEFILANDALITDAPPLKRLIKR